MVVLFNLHLAIVYETAPNQLYTICPRSLDPFDICSTFLCKFSQDFLDIHYSLNLLLPNCDTLLFFYTLVPSQNVQDTLYTMTNLHVLAQWLSFGQNICETLFIALLVYGARPLFLLRLLAYSEGVSCYLQTAVCYDCQLTAKECHAIYRLLFATTVALQ